MNNMQPLHDNTPDPSLVSSASIHATPRHGDGVPDFVGLSEQGAIRRAAMGDDLVHRFRRYHQRRRAQRNIAGAGLGLTVVGAAIAVVLYTVGGLDVSIPSAGRSPTYADHSNRSSGGAEFAQGGAGAGGVASGRQALDVLPDPSFASNGAGVGAAAAHLAWVVSGSDASAVTTVRHQIAPAVFAAVTSAATSPGATTVARVDAAPSTAGEQVAARVGQITIVRKADLDEDRLATLIVSAGDGAGSGVGQRVERIGDAVLLATMTELGRPACLIQVQGRVQLATFDGSPLITSDSAPAGPASQLRRAPGQRPTLAALSWMPMNRPAPGVGPLMTPAGSWYPGGPSAG